MSVCVFIKTCTWNMASKTKLENISLKNQKQRSKNFAKEHKSFLIERIHQKKDIIENQNKTPKTVKERSEEWTLITEEFNLRFPSAIRTKCQLVNFWKRCKISAKKEASQAKKSVKKTGGGPPGKSVGAESSMVLDSIGKDADPLTNSFDDDASIESSGSETEEMEYDDDSDTTGPSTTGNENLKRNKRATKTGKWMLLSSKSRKCCSVIFNAEVRGVIY